MHLRNYFQKKHSALLQILPEQLNQEVQSEVAILERSYPSMYQTVTEGKIMFFELTNFEVVLILLSGTRFLPFHDDFLNPWTQSFKKVTITTKAVSSFKVSQRTQEAGICHSNEGSVLAFFCTDLGHIFGSKVGNEYVAMLKWKMSYKLSLSNVIVCIHPLKIYTDMIEYNIVGDAKAPILRCFLFLYSTWTIRYLATCNSDHWSNFF